jgi:ABC-type multidrug transport system ATPase subunit
MIELGEIRDELVGIPGVSGILTEQRKRLTIAVELVSNPSVIFMDEPTSGLDARAAAIVMRVAKNIVNTNRTVVCTIHQPSIDVFEAFDEVIGYVHMKICSMQYQKRNLSNLKTLVSCLISCRVRKAIDYGSHVND